MMMKTFVYIESFVVKEYYESQLKAGVVCIMDLVPAAAFCKSGQHPYKVFSHWSHMNTSCIIEGLMIT